MVRSDVLLSVFGLAVLSLETRDAVRSQFYGLSGSVHMGQTLPQKGCNTRLGHTNPWCSSNAVESGGECGATALRAVGACGGCLCFGLGGASFASKGGGGGADFGVGGHGLLELGRASLPADVETIPNRLGYARDFSNYFHGPFQGLPLNRKAQTPV